MQKEKIKVVIASVLKPVDDTRMFEKIGSSLADNNEKYEVVIIGFPSGKVPAYPGITFLALNAFRRLSLSRLLAPWRILKIIWQAKPDILIFCTHELLFPAVLYKLIFKKKILYDVQENYFRNILFLPSFNFFLRPLLAVYVRTKELCLAPFIDHFILAEKGYEYELHFTGVKKTILENKVKKIAIVPTKKSADDGLIHLLFSGTLAETTGVFDAILLAKKLHAQEPRTRLTIIGYCAQGTTLKRIRDDIREASFINLVGGETLIPHEQIINAIGQSDAGIISYPKNPSTANAIPTKLFEYLGCRLPILLVDHKPWVDRCVPYPACVPVDFKNIQAGDILSQLKTTHFFTTLPDDVYWEPEAKKMITLLDQMHIKHQKL